MRRIADILPFVKGLDQELRQGGDSSATLKRFRRHRGGQVLLVRENPEMNLFVYDAKRVVI
ncbi:MAG: hypothetical protein ACREYE_18975 [Gammaproteobacteria bacterium]